MMKKLYEVELNSKGMPNFSTAKEVPQRKKGRWIDYVKEGYVECPFCHSATNCDDNISELHFCFSCGARMEGENDV